MGEFDLAIGVISALFILLLLPGVLSIFSFKKTNYFNTLDGYELIVMSLMMGLAIWIPISMYSYQFSVESNVPIYLVGIFIIFLAGFLLLLSRLKSNTFTALKSSFHFKNVLNVYTLVVVIQSVFIGYAAQYQTYNSDALAHLGSIRNLATLETVITCDWVLGDGSPAVNAYGCNPWHLVSGMIVKLSGVDAASAYAPLSGIIFFLSVISIYALIKSISGDIFISKIGSVIFVFAVLMNWFLAIGNSPYYNLDPISNLIFPGHFASYILFPILMAIFIKYLLSGEKSLLFATVLCVVVITRFHPNWIVWAPILLAGILLFRVVFRRNLEMKATVDYKSILIFGFVSFLSGISILLCANTFSYDSTFITPVNLWRGSGGNLLYFSKYIYLYNPVNYLMERSLFDVATLGSLWYLYKVKKISHKEVGSITYGVPNNELLTIYAGLLVAIAFVIFNPLMVLIIIKLTGSSIPLYRAFGLTMPVLSCFTIYSLLMLFKLKFEYRKFQFVTVGATVVSALLIISTHFGYLKNLYLNTENYYSTNNSPYLEPFATLRTLGRGKIGIKNTLAEPVAALTDLDPITTEGGRDKSVFDFGVNMRENDDLLIFSKTPDEITSILKKRNIRFIVIEASASDARFNLKNNPALVHFKSSAGAYEVWEVNDSL